MDDECNKTMHTESVWQMQTQILKQRTTYFDKHKSMSGHSSQGYFLFHPHLVTNGQKSLFSCHSSQTLPSNTSTAKPFSVFGFPYRNSLVGILNSFWIDCILFSLTFDTLQKVMELLNQQERPVSKTENRTTVHYLKMHTVWDLPCSSKTHATLNLTYSDTCCIINQWTEHCNNPAHSCEIYKKYAQFILGQQEDYYFVFL